MMTTQQKLVTVDSVQQQNNNYNIYYILYIKLVHYYKVVTLNRKLLTNSFISAIFYSETVLIEIIQLPELMRIDGKI